MLFVDEQIPLVMLMVIYLLDMGARWHSGMAINHVVAHILLSESVGDMARRFLFLSGMAQDLLKVSLWGDMHDQGSNIGYWVRI